MISTSGFAAVSRRPSSWYAALMRVFCSGGTACHSRTMSGPWLAAKAPTRLAMVQAPDELVVLHAGGEEVVAQQIWIGALGEKRHVVLGDRALHMLIQRVAREHLVALGAEFGGEGGRLQIEEKLREPVVAHHSAFSPAALTISRKRSWSRRMRLPNCAGVS